MYTWLSRVMAVVFLLNTLSPSYAALPTVRDSAEQSLEKKVEASTDRRKQNEAVVQERFDKYLEDMGRYRTQFEEAPTYEIMQSAYRELDKLRRQAGGEIRKELLQNTYPANRDVLSAQNELFYDYYRQNPHVAPDAISQTLGYDARYKYSPDQMRKMDEMYRRQNPINMGCPTAKDFLGDVERGTFETGLDRLLEYIDPLGGVNCRDYLAIAYAAEMLYGIAHDQLRHPDSIPQEQRDEIKSFYAQAQVRAYEALQRLNKNKIMDDSDLYAARGTLRILLVILQQVVDENGLALNEPELYFVYPSKALYNQIYRTGTTKAKSSQGFKDLRPVSIPIIKPTYEAFVAQDSYFFSSLPADMPKGYKTEKVSLSSLDAHPLAKKMAQKYFALNALPKGAVSSPMYSLNGQNRFLPNSNGDFLKELRAFKEKNPSADSKEFVVLTTEMQYVALYALFAGDESLLSETVALFEGDPKGDFKTQYSDVLGVIFDTVYEALEQFALSSVQINMAFDFLRQMAEPTHATGTRVLALHTLGMLTEPLIGNVADDASLPKFLKQQDPLDISAQFRSAVSDNDGVVNNRYWLSYADRAKFARYTADLYAPLQGVSNYTLDDYGLSSEEMVKLSNLLASTYVEFLPVMGPTVTRDECMNVAKMDTQKLTPITPESLAMASTGYILPANCDRKTKEGTFVFTSKGTVEMLLVNRTNWKKVEKENTAKGVEIFGEALFWMYGGALISGSFRALRLLSGVVKALPRAIKAGKIVYKSSQGARLTRLVVAIKRGKASVATGAKYMSQANFTANLGKNGMGYVVEEKAAAQATKGSRVAASVTPNPAAVATTGNTTTSLVKGFRTPRFMSKNKITLFAADETSGMYRMGTFPVKTERLAQMPFPLQRAEFMHFAQRQGLRNWWTGADRSLFNTNSMFQNYWLGIGKNASHIPVPGKILTYHPVLQSMVNEYGSIVKWFVGFKMLDMTTAILFSNSFDTWSANRQQELLKKEMAKYGDLFDEKKLNQGVAPVSPSAALEQVGGEAEGTFGWVDALTLPSWAWRKLSPTRADATDGALIAYPFTLFKDTFGDESPFMPKTLQEQLRTSANRLALNEAQQKRAEAKLTEQIDAWLQNLEQAKKLALADFAGIKQSYGSEWGAEQQKYEQFFDKYMASLREIKKITDLNERVKQVNELAVAYNKEFSQLEQNFKAKWEAYVARMAAEPSQDFVMMLQGEAEPQTEEAYLAEIVAYLAQLVDEETNAMARSDWMVNYPMETSMYLLRIDSIATDYTNQAKAVAAKEISFDEKKKEWRRLLADCQTALDLAFHILQETVIAKEGGYSASDYPEIYDDNK